MLLALALKAMRTIKRKQLRTTSSVAYAFDFSRGEARKAQFDSIWWKYPPLSAGK